MSLVQILVATWLRNINKSGQKLFPHTSYTLEDVTRHVKTMHFAKRFINNK